VDRDEANLPATGATARQIDALLLQV